MASRGSRRKTNREMTMEPGIRIKTGVHWRACARSGPSGHLVPDGIPAYTVNTP
jgi:hypothetical protein